jgi:hypothetical protein
MLMTGVQKVLPARPALEYARDSRAMRLPVAVQRERLKLHEVVMGSAVLDAPGSSALWCTPGPEIPTFGGEGQQS